MIRFDSSYLPATPLDGKASRASNTPCHLSPPPFDTLFSSPRCAHPGAQRSQVQTTTERARWRSHGDKKGATNTRSLSLVWVRLMLHAIRIPLKNGQIPLPRELSFFRFHINGIAIIKWIPPFKVRRCISMSQQQKQQDRMVLLGRNFGGQILLNDVMAVF